MPEKNPTLLQRLDNTPVIMFVIVAIPLGIAPIFPEPHLWGKLKMLVAGGLVRPLDIFDLFMHGAPVLALVFKLLRMGIIRAQGDVKQPD